MTAVGWFVASDFDATVQRILLGELGLVSSTQKGATCSFDTSTEFIGSHYDAAKTAQPTYRPTARLISTLQEAVGTLREAMGALMVPEGTLRAAARLQSYRRHKLHAVCVDVCPLGAFLSQ